MLYFYGKVKRRYGEGVAISRLLKRKEEIKRKWLDKIINYWFVYILNNVETHRKTLCSTNTIKKRQVAEQSGREILRFTITDYWQVCESYERLK